MIIMKGGFVLAVLGMMVFAGFAGCVESGTGELDYEADGAVAARISSSKDSAIMGEGITFDGSGSVSSGGKVLSWEWDFGDGLFGEGKSIVHHYSAAGKYLVRLMVRDSENATGSATKYVKISPAPGNSVMINEYYLDDFSGTELWMTHLGNIGYVLSGFDSEGGNSSDSIISEQSGKTNFWIIHYRYSRFEKLAINWPDVYNDSFHFAIYDPNEENYDFPMPFESIVLCEDAKEGIIRIERDAAHGEMYFVFSSRGCSKDFNFIAYPVDNTTYENSASWSNDAVENFERSVSGLPRAPGEFAIIESSDAPYFIGTYDFYSYGPEEVFGPSVEIASGVDAKREYYTTGSEYVLTTKSDAAMKECYHTMSAFSDPICYGTFSYEISGKNASGGNYSAKGGYDYSSISGFGMSGYNPSLIYYTNECEIGVFDEQFSFDAGIGWDVVSCRTIGYPIEVSRHMGYGGITRIEDLGAEGSLPIFAGI
jgi:PKD repeat protein